MVNKQVEGGLAEVNGTQLYYESTGAGDPLVLVHGGGGDRRHWDGQFQDLAKDFRVIRYDLRGYGESALPIEGQAYRHQDDLRDLLAFLGIANAHIAGYSLGCQVTVDTYMLYPELFKSIIAVGPFVSGYSSPSTDHMFGAYAACGVVFGQKGQTAAAECCVNIPAFNPDRIGVEAKARATEICADFSWWLFHHDDPVESAKPPATDSLEDIQVPLLIISADYDAAACREVADLLQQKVPHGRRVDLAGATHLMLMEQPAAFNAALRVFLKDF